MLFVLVALGACSGYRSSTDIGPAAGTSAEPRSRATAAAKDPATIIITKQDITNRPYDVLADIEASVSKRDIFTADPTPENVDAVLRKRAAEIGADAVIFVRYGSIGISLFSWGTLEGRGRAIAFQ